MSPFKRTPPPIYTEGGNAPQPQQSAQAGQQPGQSGYMQNMQQLGQASQHSQQSYGGQPGQASQPLQQPPAGAQNQTAPSNPERKAPVLGIILLVAGFVMFIAGLALVALLMLYVLLGTDHGSADFTGLHVAQAIAGVVLGVGGLGVMTAGGWQLRQSRLRSKQH